MIVGKEDVVFGVLYLNRGRMEEYNDDDKDSSTPLDLLLNAITDRRDYDPSSLVNGFGALGEGEGTLEGGEMMDLSGLLKQSGYVST